ncbi:hypothetical protein P692DRAFT_20886954 [Suillus brevipes Sb2]|nr:hypothetical protein P692DRAFT_20886954 [Suillus brevipes Sb2]
MCLLMLSLPNWFFGQTLSHSQPPAYYGGPFNPFYLSSAPGPYNAVSYGSMSWTDPQTNLPLSNYSTLNDATSATSSKVRFYASVAPRTEPTTDDD